MAIMPSITVRSAPPALCVIQARYHSARLEGKMMLKLGSETLIERAWRLACEAFGPENCVIAIPGGQPARFCTHLVSIGANVHCPSVLEQDVLQRFHHTAHTHRWHGDTVIHRWTPDDPFKSPKICRAVVEGVRAPVEIGGEAFTLAMLDYAHINENRPQYREHIGRAPILFPVAPPPAPSDDIWTVDTPEDYARACERWEREENVTGANWDRIG